MTDDTIHTCSYSCERPGCIRAQRDELVAKVEALLAEVDVLKAESARLRDALQAIVGEVSDGLVPYSSDSYLPAHLVEQARAALAKENSNDQHTEQAHE